MSRTEDLKMATVDREDFCDFHAFGHCYDAGVDKIYFGVVVIAKDIGGPLVIR